MEIFYYWMKALSPDSEVQPNNLNRSDTSIFSQSRQQQQQNSKSLDSDQAKNLLSAMMADRLQSQIQQQNTTNA